MTKILLAEDDMGIATMFLTHFKEAGLTTVHAADGQQAIEKTKQEKPDIVLLDVKMPKKEGTEVLGELKKDSATKDIPVLFLTSLGGRNEDAEAAKGLGAVDLIVKSDVTPQDVVAKINEVLGKK